MSNTSLGFPIRYLLDTNICIYVMTHKPPGVLERFLAHEAEGIGLSAITASQLHWGVHKSGSLRNRMALEKFLSPLAVVAYDLEATQQYGELRSYLDRQGTPIGPLDQQIATHALAMKVTLVSNNLREFSRVPFGLLRHVADI
jgi:tRNA(fMet)-specific endonuclease VapC